MQSMACPAMSLGRRYKEMPMGLPGNPRHATLDDGRGKIMTMLRRIWLTSSLVFLATLIFATFGVSFAAFSKSHEPVVIRNGFAQDYLLLATIMAVVGIVVASATVWLLMRLFRPKPPAPVSHF